MVMDCREFSHNPVCSNKAGPVGLVFIYNRLLHSGREVVGFHGFV